MKIHTVACGLAASLFLFGACTDPTANMTPEQKKAYYEEQARQREEREKARKAFEARVIQDLTTEGEAHQEARDLDIAGWYSYAWDRPEEKVPFFHKQVRQGTRYKAEHLTLFRNGSYARRVDKDVWEYDKGSQGFAEPQAVTRGQWKTEGNRFLTRPITMGGYGDWEDVAGYEKKGTHLVMIEDKAIKAEIERRNLKEDQGKEALMILGEHTFNWAPK